ncbi:hypothetical protein DL769_006303 [Monosporascus sp. CRB-8-3]|nr:hypothetical protein DL769_006303 [Monosporascus sp. CRB-8-3]
MHGRRSLAKRKQPPVSQSKGNAAKIARKEPSSDSSQSEEDAAESPNTSHPEGDDAGSHDSQPEDDAGGFSDSQSGEDAAGLAGEASEEPEQNPLPGLYNLKQPLDPTSLARINLRNHISNPARGVFFWVELTPQVSQIGVLLCGFPTCNRTIDAGDYVITVYPGVHTMGLNPRTAECFEKLADFSKPRYLSRLRPTTRHTVPLGIGPYNAYALLDGGAERLIIEWESVLSTLINRRAGNPWPPPDLALYDILHSSGRQDFHRDKPADLSDYEYFLLTHQLAPIESDGPHEEDEWDLFDEYYRTDNPQNIQYQAHRLGEMLRKWQHDKVLANSFDDELDENQIQRKKDLGRRAIRAIRRLSQIPRPYRADSN